jgi:hypothetical protein
VSRSGLASRLSDDDREAQRPARSSIVGSLHRRLGGEGLALIGIAVIALVARVVALTSSGFNSDEAVYAGQGGALLHVSDFDRFFSLFRAHPLLFQATVGLVFRVVGPSDLAARLVAVGFGLGAIGFTWAAARELFGRRVGLVTALLCAVVPYHVLVSRQALVDTALGCFVALAFFGLSRAVCRDRPGWAVVAAVSLGLATLSKETAVIFVPAAVVILLLARRRGRLRAKGLWLWSFVGFVVPLAPFPLTRLVASPSNAQSIVLWQLTRAANHSADYFARVLLQFGTIPVVVLGLAGLVLLVARHTERDVMVLLWVVPAFAYYTLWPTKLFPYLFPMFGAFCIAAAVAVDGAIAWLVRPRPQRPWLRAVAVAAASAAVALVIVGSGRAVFDSESKSVASFNDFDVEVQTFAGVREFARWAEANTPARARFLTIGPSLGNILRFYGHRESVALSVSPDPAKRNPAYVPVENPDLALRQLSIHYVVWDAYSADRTTFYSERLLHVARRFGGRPVFSVYVDRGGALRQVAGAAPDGAETRLQVFDVPGVAPIDESAEAEG